MQPIKASSGMSGMVRPKPRCDCGLEMFYDRAIGRFLCPARFDGRAVHRAQLSVLRSPTLPLQTPADDK
jgi:hypothetical protein